MAESRQVVVRNEGQETCVHHKGRTLEFFCEKCQDVACTKCVTTVHRGHVMSDLSDIAVIIKEDIRGFIEDTEENKLPQSQKNIQSTNNELKTNAEYFDTLSKEATNQAERLKQEIDLMTAKTLSFYLRLKEENVRLLTNYKHELEKGYTEMRKQTQECKRLLQTASDITLFDARDKVKKCGVQSSDKPTLRTARFYPTKRYREFLEQAFGTRTSSEAGNQMSIVSRHTPTLSNKTNQERQKNVTPSNYTLLPETKVLMENETDFATNALCCSKSQEAYLCFPFGNYSKLHVYDMELKEKKIIQIDKDIADLIISRETNNIWATCHADKSIIEITSGSPTIRFHTEDKPRCLCVTMDNHVLVGMIGRITKFSMDGKVVLISDNCMVSKPYKIRECPVTNNVAVVDLQEDQADKVLVLDKDLCLLFCYCGDIPRGQHYKGEPFSPYSVAFDSVGHIVMGDKNNKHILLLDGNGQFIRILHTTNNSPSDLDIDTNNVLWVVYYNCRIEQLQYCT